jgi:hypothetical protein
MSTNESEIGIGAEAFAKGTWYHELLEDGLALSYRVRARENDTAAARELKVNHLKYAQTRRRARRTL